MARAIKQPRRPTKPSRRPLPQRMQNNILRYAFFKFQGRKYRYAVIDGEIEPDFPTFVRGHHKDQLAISDKVPKDLREYILIHELLVFFEYSDSRQPHISSINRLLDENIVPVKILRNFADFLIKHYWKLIDHYNIEKSSNDKHHQSILQGYGHLCGKISTIKRRIAAA